ncbi:hypothetical protein FALBO_4510 [Fusarium albosuccineum]|uniref:F-box domain-containing protein n=1 Tax=Fusarium albosuccineum TaxID=1237068 RepID=A0A8H4LHT7_9HYPO|nr:hypothetical protein FALBO_4510 [Fusarium albosuccineum]
MKRLIAKFKRSAKIQPSLASEHPTVSDAAIADEVTTTQQDGHEPEPKPAKPVQNAPLEDLPAEVRRHLLSVLDLPQLKALVRASPTFHQQYVFDRKYLLCRSLENTLGSVMFDAYACQLSQSSDWKQFQQDYTEKNCLPPSDQITQETAAKIAVFHTNYVTPIVRYFSDKSLNHLLSLTKDLEGDKLEAALSTSEAMRFTRAVYRFEILCQVAGPHSETDMFLRTEAAEQFFLIFEPWEVEELLSFYQFVEPIYDDIFKQVRDDFHPDNPRFDDQPRPPTPEGAFDFDHRLDRDNLLEGTILRGLCLLHTVLFDIKDHQHLVCLMQENLAKSYMSISTSAGGMFGSTHQLMRREAQPSDRDRMQDEKVPMPFPGDGVPDAPPLAWAMIWGSTYSNIYGWYIPDDTRPWGYIFWDAARLERTGGKELLQQQWEKCWEDEDPRDDLF